MDQSTVTSRDLSGPHGPSMNRELSREPQASELLDYV